MALKVYNEVLGYIDLLEDKKQMHIEIRKSNCLAAFVYKKRNEIVLYDFIVDVQHAENVLKRNTGFFYEGIKELHTTIKKIVLNSTYKTQTAELANIFKKANYSFEYIEF